MRRGNMPEAPNYTNAALVMGAINLFCMLAVLWMTFGLPVVLLAGFAIDRLIFWCARR